MIRRVCRRLVSIRFVVLNVGNIIDMSWVENIILRLFCICGRVVRKVEMVLLISLTGRFVRVVS